MKSVSKEKLVYAYRRDLDPVLRVQPGEVFEVETEDCFSGQIRKPEDFSLDAIDKWVHINNNALTGPIYVEGAHQGDAVAVKIHDIVITSPGIVIVSRYNNPSPLDWWDEPDEAWIMPIEKGYIILDEKIKVPVSPLIGCLGTACDRETYLSIREGPYGGNMDCGLMGIGATVYLPVYIEGAYLYFGDCKARTNDGEITSPPEVATKLTLSVEVNKQLAPLAWPRMETEDSIMTLVSDKPFEVAARMAYKEMLMWLEAEYEFERKKAAILMGMVANTRVCQISCTLYTAMCVMPKEYLQVLG